MDQHFVPLDFAVEGGGLRVAAPWNANDAPPGYYMLFIVDSRGVPSTASMIHVGGDAGPAPQRPESLPADPEPDGERPPSALPFIVKVPDLASSGAYALSAFPPPGVASQTSASVRSQGLAFEAAPARASQYFCQRPSPRQPMEAVRQELAGLPLAR